MPAQLPEGFVLDSNQVAPPPGFQLDGAPQMQRQPTLDERLMQVPGIPQLTEFLAGANREIVSAADFFGPGLVNSILQLAGSDKRVPTLNETIGPKIGKKGEAVGEGLQADILAGAGSMAAMSAGAGGALRAGANALSPLAKSSESAARGVIRNMGSTTAGQDLAAGALSGAGAAVGEKVGGAPGAAIGAMAAPMIPTLAKAAGSEAVRQVFRGGGAGRQAMASTVDDAARAGTELSVGTATGRPSLQGVENISKRVVGGGPLIRASDKSAEQIKARLARIADDISGTRGAEASGRVVNNAIQGRGGFVDRFQTQSGTLWNKVDDAIGAQSQVPVSNTKSMLDTLVKTDEIGSILNTPKIAQIQKAMTGKDSIDYETLRSVRSFIGAKMSNTDLVSDIPKAELKRLYGAITEDIKAVASATGDDAAKAFARANNYTRAGHQRIEGFVENVLKRGEFSKIYSAVTKGGEGTQTINAFKRSMKPEEWEVVASNVIRELGKSSAGRQGADGTEFSINQFMSDWNKLGPAKKAMFSGSRTLDHFGRDLDAIARTAERIKVGSQVASNPSGSGQFVANVGAAATLGTSAATGNFPVFSATLGALAINNMAARVMSNPRFVSWLAGTTRANTKDMGAQLTKLLAIQQSLAIEDAKAIDSVIQQLDSGEDSVNLP